MNSPASLVATIALTLSLFGCVTGEKMSRLHPGMTKAEVVSVLGRPDGYKEIAGYEVYRYSNRLSSGWS
jgi:outer membrane protein assembly factor BamE (lipoprotein component of BamABCDE complex)